MRLFSLTLAAMLALIILFPSCRQEDYTVQIKTLDSLGVNVDTAWAELNKIQIDTIAAINDSVEKHLQYVQQNYVGSMRKDMAEELSNYRSIKKLVPDVENRLSEAGTEVERTRIQLAGLKKALTDGSTHDALGNELTPEYVAQLFTTERQSAEKLIKELNLISERSASAKEQFNLYYPKVRFWVDSIPVKAKSGSAVN